MKRVVEALAISDALVNLRICPVKVRRSHSGLSGAGRGTVALVAAPWIAQWPGAAASDRVKETVALICTSCIEVSSDET